MAKVGRLRLAKVLAGRLKAGDKRLARETAAYLLSEGRVGELDSLLRDVAQYRADHDGRIEVEAITAHPLTAATKKAIERRIKAADPSAKQIVISERHDPSVIGGVRLELANQQLDLSVRGQLNRFKQLTAVGK
jgi:F0F1-type ATP synthase delta subunit